MIGHVGEWEHGQQKRFCMIFPALLSGYGLLGGLGICLCMARTVGLQRLGRGSVMFGRDSVMFLLPLV